MVTLAASKRSELGKSSKGLTSTGVMPAVVYGPTQESTSITVPLSEFKKVLRDAGETSIISLTGLDEALQVLIHAVDLDPITNLPRHADFYAIEKGAKVEIAVPLVFIGESAAVKAGANLVKVAHELEIEAEPTNLPHDIQVDISVLANIGDQIHVKDIKLPAGVTLKGDAEQIIALVQEVKVEEEVPTAGPDMAAIEVEKKGKTDEEGAEGEGKE